MKELREYIACECHSELLELVYFPDDKTLDISYYSYGQSGRQFSWGTRFRFIWKILKTGTIFNDYIMLNPEEIKKLKKFLEKIK